MTKPVALALPIMSRLPLIVLGVAVAAFAGSCRLFDFGQLTVTSFSPSASQLSNLTGVAIEVEFSKSVNQSVTEQAFTITADSNPLPGRIDWPDDRTLRFTPYEQLQAGVIYTMGVSIQAEDSYGADLNQPFSHTFSTRTSFTRPTVASASPADHSSVTNRLSPISIVFSEPMLGSSVDSAFSISPSVSGLSTMSSDGKTFTFTPTQQLQWQTEYTVTVGTGARDLQGNSLGSAFTTHLFVGTSSTPPSVASATNSSGTITLTADSAAGPITVTSGWEATDSLVITFSQPVVTSSAISSITITPNIQSTVTEANTQTTSTLTYHFSPRLTYGTTYTASIASGIPDAQGNTSTQALAYHFLVNGQSTLPPSVAQVNFLTNPAVALASSPSAPTLDPLSPYSSVTFDTTDYPVGTAVETYFDVYVNVAAGATLDPLVVGRAFSTNITNNAVSITPIAVQIDPSLPAPQPSVGTNQVIARVYVDITNNGSSGVVTLQFATTLTDSAGNPLAQQYLLPVDFP